MTCTVLPLPRATTIKSTRLVLRCLPCSSSSRVGPACIACEARRRRDSASRLHATPIQVAMATRCWFGRPCYGRPTTATTMAETARSTWSMRKGKTRSTCHLLQVPRACSCIRSSLSGLSLCPRAQAAAQRPPTAHPDAAAVTSLLRLRLGAAARSSSIHPFLKKRKVPKMSTVTLASPGSSVYLHWSHELH
jgi:hypothetical protein